MASNLNKSSSVSNQEANQVRNISIVLFILGVICLVYVFRISVDNVGQAGSIGDTIAGVLGTFVNLGAAILVYISFREQVKANKEIAKQLMEERLLRFQDLGRPSSNITEIVSIYFSFRKDCIAIQKYGRLEFKNFDNFTNLLQKVRDNESEFAKLLKIYSATNLSMKTDLDGMQKLIMDEFMRNITPYKWMLKIDSNTLDNDLSNELKIPNIPILKIDCIDIDLNENSKIQFSKGNSNIIKILKLITISKKNEEKIIPFERELHTYNTSLSISDIINFRNYESEEYKFIWHLEFEENLFIYADEYLISK